MAKIQTIVTKSGAGQAAKMMSWHDFFTYYTFLIAFLAFLCSSGCTTVAPTGVPTHRQTEAEFAQEHNALATKILPDTITLEAGKTFEFEMPADTMWESHNQSVLMVGQRGRTIIITARKKGKASFGGRNVYFFDKRQTVNVIVK
jgi:hypothetical protein